jgi:GT2 family glycosyltransferase
MEEIDMCWRMKNRGYKVVYIPNSVVYHVGGGTLPNNNPRKLFYNYRNNLFLLYKNLSKNNFRYILLIRMILDGMSAVMYLFQGKFSFFAAVFKAHMAFYSSLKKIREARNENIKKQNTFHHPEIFRGSIIFSFFVKRINFFSELTLKSNT